MSGRRLAVLVLSIGSLAGPAAAEGPRFPVRQVLPGAPLPPADGGVPRRIADRVSNAWDREQIREDVEEGYALDALEGGLPASDGTLPQEQPPSRPLAVPGVPEILPRRLAPITPANVAPAGLDPTAVVAPGGTPPDDEDAAEPMDEAPLADGAETPPPSRPLAVPGVPEIMPRQPEPIAPADVGPRFQPSGLGEPVAPPAAAAAPPPIPAAAMPAPVAGAGATPPADAAAAEPAAAAVEPPADPDAAAAAASDAADGPAAAETPASAAAPAPADATAPSDTADHGPNDGVETAVPVAAEAQDEAAPAATAETEASPPVAEPADATAAADGARPASDVAPAADAGSPDAAAADVAATPADGDAAAPPVATNTPADGDAAGHAASPVGAPETATAPEEAERGETIAPPISAETRRDAAAEATDGAAATPAAPAEDPANTPVRLVRTLQLLQDQIARGSTAALKGQRALLSRIEARFGSVGPETWQTPANAYALVTFVLSGGNPATLRDVLGRTPLPPIDENLMRGALAYVDGRENEASDFLAGIEPLDVPASMGAQLALARAALAVRDDTTLAVALLDSARLLAPGTLAEEAALRREIFVVSQIGDVEKFEILATQYLMRFRHSVYAGNFRQRFAAALTRMDFIDNPNEFVRLDSMISDLDLESRLDIYLLVARAAVNRGLTNASTLASERGLSLAEEGSVEASRARLYRAAALVVTPQGLAAGMDDLNAIDPTRLPPDDAALHQAASSTAKLILTAPDLPDTRAPLPPQAETAAADAVPMPEVATRAQDALAAVDELLKRSSR